MRQKVEIDIPRAIELFKKYNSWRAVARELGVHPYIVQYRLQPLGYHTVQNVGMARSWDIQKAIQLRTKEGKTFREIGEILGVATSTVQKALGSEYKKRVRP